MFGVGRHQGIIRVSIQTEGQGKWCMYVLHVVVAVHTSVYTSVQ